MYLSLLGREDNLGSYARPIMNTGNWSSLSKPKPSSSWDWSEKDTLGLAGDIVDFGDALYKGISDYSNTRLAASAKGEQAKDYLRQAKEFVRAAGLEQKRGTEAASMRYSQLGEDIGHIYGAAAGSGIDVSSATVRDVVHGNRLEARRDAQTIMDNAREAARAQVYNAMNARIAAVNARAEAKIMRRNASYGLWSSVVKGVGKIAVGAMQKGMES